MSGRVGLRNELVDAFFLKELIGHAASRHPHKTEDQEIG
jgi:hypothetical protein